MRPVLFIMCAALLLTACRSSQETADRSAGPALEALDPIVARARETSLYSDRVDWAEVQQRFVEIRTANSGELLGALQYLINSLGDEHAAIRSAKDFSIVAFYQGDRAHPDPREPDFLRRVINDTSARFSCDLLEPGVGYLKVVGIGPGDVLAQAQQIRSGLADLKKRGADRWILDLRVNGGGNMEPMLAGLAPLLGDGFVGGAMNRNGEVTREYRIEDGQFFNSDRLVCEMPNTPTIAPTEKVAVLLSRYTASSGELVAVAFKGRAHTRFIGEPTAGYTTGTGFDPISDDYVMLISQDRFMDRDRNSYDRNVGVDEVIEFQHEVELGDDLQVRRALEWLNP